MPVDRDIGDALAEQVANAAASLTPLSIQAQGTKAFYGRDCNAQPLDVSGHRGIIDYDPSELVLTARAGTPLLAIETLLNEHGQYLGFEPPRFGDGTLGGSIATGLSGPRRPYAGSARDFVLGIRCINGRGEQLGFGGRIMKNVAGYDASRLMCGALGTLGVLLDISIKVLPRDEYVQTHCLACSHAEAITTMNALAGRAIPLTAAAWHDGTLSLRLSGNRAGIESVSNEIGGDILAADAAAAFWQGLRDQQHAFFAGDTPLWRLSLPPATLPLQLDGELLLDWGGAQRWYRGNEPAEVLRTLCRQHGGHATLFRHGDRHGEVFAPLETGIARLHQAVKQAFDPHGLFNPGRLYREF